MTQVAESVVDTVLQGNLLPTKAVDLTRTVRLMPGARIDGCVVAARMIAPQGEVVVDGPVVVTDEVDCRNAGAAQINGPVYSGRVALLCGSDDELLVIHGDVIAPTVRLERAIVVGSVIAKTIRMTDSAILGAVNGTGETQIADCYAGTIVGGVVETGGNVIIGGCSAVVDNRIDCSTQRLYSGVLLDIAGAAEGADIGALDLVRFTNEDYQELDTDLDGGKAALFLTLAPRAMNLRGYASRVARTAECLRSIGLWRHSKRSSDPLADTPNGVDALGKELVRLAGSAQLKD